MQTVEQRGGGRVLDGTELRRDESGLTHEDPLAVLVELQGRAVLLELPRRSGDLDLELAETGHGQRLTHAGRAEDDVGDVPAGAELGEVEPHELLGAAAGLGLEVAPVLHRVVRGGLEVGVAGGDELVLGVGGRGEGVEVDLLLDDATTLLRCPDDVDEDLAGQNRVVGAHLVEVELLLHVDTGLAAVAGGAVQTGHFCRSILSHVREG